jgi:threonine-phosphate decarboxylase
VPWIARLEPAVHGSLDASAARRSGVDPSQVLDFSANGNVIGPPPGAADAIARVDLARYPDRGATALRQAIAERHGASTQIVVVGNGSSELIWGLARTYLRPGDGALVLGPTYGEYEVATQAAGGEAVTLPALAPGRLLDLEALGEAAAALDPRLIWLCHPNNPTGAPMPDRVVPTLLAAVPGALVVVDEAYLPLCADIPSMLDASASGRVVVLRSMTKDAALAGLRIGYLVSTPDVATMVGRALPPWSVSSVAQAAGLVALADTAHAARARRAVAESRAHLVDGLAHLGLRPYPSVANFVLVPVGDGLGVTRALLSRGCAVRDCTSFGLPDCIRIGVRSIPDQERLLGALAEVGDG